MPKLTDSVAISSLDADLQAFILDNDPSLREQRSITYGKVFDYRVMYINQLLSKELTSTKEFNAEFKDRLDREHLVASDLNEQIAKNATFGQRMADRIARVAGSWPFIITFVLFIVVWMVLNITGIFFKPFDVYPFILLNLALSCIAAIQAPIIMMSQNRQALRDRAEADNDYQTNLKSEIEITLLHEKIDYLMSTKWNHILALQQLQIELLGKMQNVPLSEDLMQQSENEEIKASNQDTAHSDPFGG